MKQFLRFIIISLFFSVNSNAQGTRLSISEIEVKTGDTTLTSKEIIVPFTYGKWSQKYELIKAGGTMVKASFKLESPKNQRSEMKNSSVEFYVYYEVIHAGDKRDKKAEHIYYLDAKRSFECEETFSFKANRYDIKIVNLKFKATLGE